MTVSEVSFTCPRCGMTSFNPNDARERYCGNCHDWTGLPAEARGRTEGFYGLTLTPLEYGGFRVKETPTHWVDVIPMIYNWRVVRTPKACPLAYDRGWCYQGTGPQEFAAAVLAASAWDGADDTEPAGYFKRAGA